MDIYGYLSSHYGLAMEVLKPIYLGSVMEPDGIIVYRYHVTTPEGNKILDVWRDYDGVNIVEC